MRDAVFEVRIPAELMEFGIQQTDVQQQVLEWLVLSLFKDGHVSSGKAAKLLNRTRGEFLTLLHRRGIAYIDFTPEEIAEEIAAANAIQIETRS